MEAASLFRLLATRHRLRILRLLEGGAPNVHELTFVILCGIAVRVSRHLDC